MFAKALCPHCGNPIDWIATATGKPVMVERPLVEIITERGRLAQGKLLHHCPTEEAHARESRNT